jgi:hypothetical protein
LSAQSGTQQVVAGPLHAMPLAQTSLQQMLFTGLQMFVVQSLSSLQLAPSPSSGRHWPSSQWWLAIQ